MKYIFFGVLLLPFLTLANNYYVSVNGSSLNDGSFTNPWSLSGAFDKSGIIKPGDSIWLRAGIYLGSTELSNQVISSFTCRLSGSKELPIVFIQYPGEIAILDGANRTHPVPFDFSLDSHVLAVVGDYVHFVGFVIRDSNIHDRADSLAGFKWRVRSILALGSGIKFINMIVHDTGNGFGYFAGCEECEAYGNILFYNGWSHLGVRGHGEGFYCQNSGKTKFIRDNILFRQFDSGIILYGSSDATIDNFHLEGNVIFDNGQINDEPNGWGFLIGRNTSSKGPCNNFVFQNNYLYNKLDYRRSNNMDLAYQSGLQNVVVKDNYSVGFNAIKYNIPIQNFSITGNTFVGTIGNAAINQVSRDSNYIYSLNQMPTKNSVFIRNNIYERGRGHIVIYNWENLKQINVDIENLGLMDGDEFEVLDVQNIFGKPIYTSIYSLQNSIINLPLQLTTTTSVIGDKVPKTAQHTDPVFNVFLVKKTYRSINKSIDIQSQKCSVVHSHLQNQIYLNENIRYCDYKIMDLMGRIIRFGKTSSNYIDIENLNPGIHFLQLESKDCRSLIRFVKD